MVLGFRGHTSLSPVGYNVDARSSAQLFPGCCLCRDSFLRPLAPGQQEVHWFPSFMAFFASAKLPN
jgi:hypothetical protein